MYKKGSIKPEWITEGFTDESPVAWAKEFATFLAKKESPQYLLNCKTETATEKALSTSKLRKFFGQVKRIQADKYENSKDKVFMLSPQLAYAVGRDKKNVKGKVVNETRINYLSSELTTALSHIKNEKHFKNFVNIMEAIVAYHKAEGGE